MPTHLIRTITTSDFPELLVIGHESYDYQFDDDQMVRWATAALGAPGLMAYRTDDAFAFGQVAGAPWNLSELHGVVLYFAMRKTAVWQGCKILRTMRDCAMSSGAIDFQFGEATNMRMDVFARRIGAVPNRPTFIYRPEAA